MEQRDFFISYSKEDKIQAEWVAKMLQRHGYSVFIQLSDSGYGESFVGWINYAIEASKNFISVWSYAYLNSKWCRNELEAAYKLKVDGRIRQLLPVRVEDYPIQGALYGPLSYVDLFGKKEPDATKDLLNAIGYDGRIITSEWGEESEEDSDELSGDENHVVWNNNDYSIFPDYSKLDFIFMCLALCYFASIYFINRHVYNTVLITLFFISYIAGPPLGLAFYYKTLRCYFKKGYRLPEYIVIALTSVLLLYLIVSYGEYSGFDTFMRLLWWIIGCFQIVCSCFQFNECLGTTYFKLGFKHDFKSDSRRDHKKALRYYNIAAARGNSFALNNLGCIYAIGQGVVKDFSISLNYYKKSASKGNTLAYLNLGVLYEFGLGVAQNSRYAMDCYQEALANGDSEALIYIYRLNQKMEQQKCAT